MIEPTPIATPARIHSARRAFVFALLAPAVPLLIDGLHGLARGEAPLLLLGWVLPARRALFELAVGAALVALTLGLVAGFSRAGAARTAAIGLAAFALLQANTRLIGSGDTLPAAFLPFVMLRQGTVTFEQSGIHNRAFGLDDHPLPYWLVERSGRVASMYPLATAALAAIPELPSVLGGLDPSAPEMSDVEKNAAAFLTALAVVLIYLTLRRLAGERAALLATAIVALATPVATICGQALFQHTGAVLAFSAAGWALFCLDEPRLRALGGGFAVGLAIACRPVDVFLALGFAAAFVARERRPHRWPLALAAAAMPVAVLTLAYQAWVFGSPWATGYGEIARTGWDGRWTAGFIGLLASPARGMLVVFPVLALAAWKLARPGRAEPARRPLQMLGLGALLFLAVMAKWRIWDGAFSAGPRMLADTVPVLALGLGLWLRDLERGFARPLTVACAAVALVNAALLVYVPPSARVKRQVWQLDGGAWRLGAYPAIAYLSG